MSNVKSLKGARMARALQHIHCLMLEWDALWKENDVPLYEWKCSKCNQTVSIVRPVSEYQSLPDETEAKPCNEGETHEFSKVIGGGNFKLIGSGWARDGYR